MSDIGGRWRRVHSLEWHEAPFHTLSDAEKVIYFYARTGPQSTSVGIYRISSAVAVEEIGNLTAFEFDVRLSAVCEAFDWRLDATSRVLWMPDWIRKNPPQSPNVCTSWRKLLTNLPDCDLKFEAVDAIERYLKELPETFREAFGSLSKELRNSKPKPKAQPESHQGAGDQGIQGSGKRGTGFGVDGKLIDLARRAVKLTRNEPLQNAYDEFLRLDRQHTYTTEQIYKALEAASTELRASA